MKNSTRLMSPSVADNDLDFVDRNSSYYVQAGVERLLRRDINLSINEKDKLPVTTDISNVISLPVFQSVEGRPSEFFAALQEWNGVVTSIEKDHFTADLVDVSNGSRLVEEVAEIPLDEISPADRAALREGMIFRWLVGWSKTRGGTFSKKHQIYLRSIPPRLQNDDAWDKHLDALIQRNPEAINFG